MLSNEEIKLRLSVTEDAFVERKTITDSKDWVKTIVAFANSTPLDGVGILFIGMRDGGEIEQSVNLDSVQKTLTEKTRVIYPPAYFETRIIDKDGDRLLAVVVPGSPKRPHFAGLSYVRKGSESISASEEQFAELIAERTSKVYEIRKWIGKEVSLQTRGRAYSGTNNQPPQRVVDCSHFWVTLTQMATSPDKSTPLEDVTLSFDNVANRLLLRILEH